MTDDFITSFANELSNPLVVARGYLNILSEKDKSFSQEQQDCIKKIGDSLEHAITLSENILNLDLLQKNNLSINLKPIRIDSLVDRVINDLSTDIKKNNISLQNIRKYALPATSADHIYLHQLLVILFDNLIKISSDSSTIKILMRQKVDKIHIRLIADRIIISQNELKKLSQSLKKINTKTSLNNLNIFFAGKMATAMSCQIYFRNLGNKNFSFNLVLPSCKQLSLGI